MQRSGTEAIRAQIQPSKLQIVKIQSEYMVNRVSSYFPKGGPQQPKPNLYHMNTGTRKVKRHRNSDTKNREPQNKITASERPVMNYWWAYTCFTYKASHSVSVKRTVPEIETGLLQIIHVRTCMCLEIEFR